MQALFFVANLEVATADLLCEGRYTTMMQVRSSGARVQGSGCRFQGSGFRVPGSGFRVQGLFDLQVPPHPKRKSFVDHLLVRIHFFIVMMRWTGLAPWVFE